MESKTITVNADMTGPKEVRLCVTSLGTTFTPGQVKSLAQYVETLVAETRES